MAQELTKKEIYDRMQEWRNIQKLHAAAIARNKTLTELIATQKEQIMLLKEQNGMQSTLIQTQGLRIEELELMVFGKKKRKAKEEADNDEGDDTPDNKGARTPRLPSSYHRPLPKHKDITGEKTIALPTDCSSCHVPLTDTRTKTFFTTDIVLPTAEAALTETIKHTVHQGYCPGCRKWQGMMPIPATNVVIGERTRAFVTYAAIILRLSHRQTQHLLNDLYHFTISQGEIGNILSTEAMKLTPEHERLKLRIRGQTGVHYDETNYAVHADDGSGNYAWVMTGTETPETVFAIGKSRGKGSAEQLKGDAAHIGISDNYGAYANLFAQHQLCWAHPLRKFRELAQSDTLDAAMRTHCKEMYAQFSVLYRTLREEIAKPFTAQERERAYPTLSLLFDKCSAPHVRDPKKLAVWKTSLREQKDNYFVCLFHEGIPADNNKAERALRHLVLKRKISFGCATAKGAETLSVLASVLLSLWWTKPTDFFGEYLSLRQNSLLG